MFKTWHPVIDINLVIQGNITNIKIVTPKTITFDFVELTTCYFNIM